MLEMLAILTYGVLANIAALIMASMAGSMTGALLVFMSAGLAYIFQVVQMLAPDRDGLRNTLMAAAIGALILSAVVSFTGY
jgi:hypothetical protein